MSSIDKLSKKLSDLKAVHSKLNVAGLKVDTDKLENLKKDFKNLESEFKKISIKSELHFWVSSIQQSLSKVELGLNDSSSIIGDAEKINEVLNSYSDIRSGIESFSKDIEELIKDINDEQSIGKNASIVAMLDRIASIFEGRGLVKEAETLDEISNALESINKKAGI